MYKNIILPAFLVLVVPSIALAAPATAYDAWLCSVWGWAADIILPLSTIMIMVGGFMWSTSGGEPKRIEKAKEIFVGVASGLGFLLLSYFIVANIIGVDVSLLPGRDCIWNK